MEESNKNQIIERRKVKEIRFDVFMDDIGRGDWGDPVLSNVGYIEACCCLGECSYFSFKVTEHGNSANIFLSGHCHKDMRSAEHGDESVSLGWATKEECEKIYKMTRSCKRDYTCNKCGESYKKKSSLELCENCEREFEEKLAKDD